MPENVNRWVSMALCIHFTALIRLFHLYNSRFHKNIFRFVGPIIEKRKAVCTQPLSKLTYKSFSPSLEKLSRFHFIVQELTRNSPYFVLKTRFSVVFKFKPPSACFFKANEHKSYLVVF